jgi:NADH-quinone oxidoreductase subunit N
VGGAAGGISAAVLYVVVYTIASAGTFAALAYLGGVDREVNNLEDIAGLSREQPLAAAVIAICMFSLAGIPPLAGFWGKLALFAGALRAATDSSLAVGGPSASLGMTLLAIAGAVNAAIAAAYYLRVVAAMYFGESRRKHGGEGGWGAQSAMILAAVLVLLVGIFPGSMTNSARRAELQLVRPVAATASNPDQLGAK